MCFFSLIENKHFLNFLISNLTYNPLQYDFSSPCAKLPVSSIWLMRHSNSICSMLISFFFPPKLVPPFTFFSTNAISFFYPIKWHLNQTGYSHQKSKDIFSISFYQSTTKSSRFDHLTLFQICTLFFPYLHWCHYNPATIYDLDSAITFRMASLLISCPLHPLQP